MNVLMTTDTVGGVWTYGLELARALRPRGVHIRLAAMGGPLSAAQRAQAAADGVDVWEGSFRLEWMQDSTADVAAAGDWLLTLAKALDADVIHLNGYAHATLPWAAPVLVTAHSCVCSWWRAVHECAAPEPEWTGYRHVVAASLAAADLVVAPTRALLDSMAHEYGTLGRTRVIANGSRLRTETSPAKQPFIISAGRLWDPAKNLATLRAAAAGVPWPIRVAGPLTAPDGRTVEAAPLELLGTLAPHELHALLERAAIYAAPALYEPFGLAILEAAQAGCTLVLADIPTLRELWDGAAMFVAPRDAAALARTLGTAIENASLRCELSERARERARRYDAGTMADGYLAAYREIRERYRKATAICA